MAFSVVRCLSNCFCSMTTSLLVSYTGTNRPRKIHFNNVLISFLSFVSRPVSYLLTLIRKNCLSTSVLLLLKKFQRKHRFQNTFIIINVCIRHTNYFLLQMLTTNVILATVLLRFQKNSTKSILSSFDCI